jgi:hypothetical protein
MKKILNYILIGILIGFTYSCDEDINDGASFNYVTFEDGPTDFEVEKDATSSREIYVYAANKTGSARTYDILVNEASNLTAAYTVDGSVTIPADSNVGSFMLSVTDDEDLGFVAQTLMLDFMDVSGANLSDGLTVNVTELCTDNKVALNLTFDQYAEETSWEIQDASGAVLFSGGQGGVYDDLDETSLSISFCIPDGDYTFVINDAFGDGMCCDYGNGGYSLITFAGATLASGGEAFSSESTSFSLP